MINIRVFSLSDIKFGCVKETSQWDVSFTYPKHMLLSLDCCYRYILGIQCILNSFRISEWLEIFKFEFSRFCCTAWWFIWSVYKTNERYSLNWLKSICILVQTLFRAYFISFNFDTLMTHNFLLGICLLLHETKDNNLRKRIRLKRKYITKMQFRAVKLRFELNSRKAIFRNAKRYFVRRA